MNRFLRQLAFYSVRCSYDLNLPYLKFITRSDNETVPIRHYHHDDKLPTMLVCNGCYEDIGWTDPVALADKFKVNVCLFEYSGYGMHSCQYSTEEYCNQDTLTVYHYLIEHISPEKIIIYGRSLGSGPACYLSHLLCENHVCENNIKHRLILVSPFLSVGKALVDCISSKNDIFRNYELASNINCQVLLIHGDDDYLVPYSHSERLADLFSNLYKFVTIHNAGHCDIRDYALYDESMNEFLNQQ
jgi:pimeloyl-ACP methyl ester carboxylesterase